VGDYEHRAGLRDRAQPGLRIAVGASGRDILTQFLVDALALSLLGGLIGVWVGLGTAYTISYVARWIQPQAVLVRWAVRR
jgi:putative ABC transport system permease protein